MELFTLRLTVGTEASIPAVSAVMTDLTSIGDAAIDIASLNAKAESRRYLSEVVTADGLRGLLSLVRRRELATQLEEDMEYLEESAYEFDHFVEEYRWEAYRWLAPSRGRFLSAWLSPGLISPLSETPWDSVVQQLIAIETESRLPSQNYRIRSLTYSNPFTVEVIAVSGAAAGALGYLLNVIAGLGSRHRREQARAGAEERVQRAHAREMEDLVERRMELRRFLLDSIARGEIDLRAEDISEAFLDKFADAANRLADAELGFEQSGLPSDGS